MRRIRHISALEILIVWNKKNYYTVDLDYGIVLSSPESIAGDGYPTGTATAPEAVPAEKDCSELKSSPSNQILTIAAMQCGN